MQNTPSQSNRVIHPKKFEVYVLDEVALKLQLMSLSNNATEAQQIELPMPDGTLRAFKVWQTPMLPDGLAAKYPQIATFTAEAVTNRSITAKLDFTVYGFHAMIFNGDNTSMIDPYDHFNDGYYMVHYKKDEQKPAEERMKCGAMDEATVTASSEIKSKRKTAGKLFNGYELRTYRAAIGCSHQYAQAATGLASPTVAQALSMVTTTMNRVNGVYERELSITMTFVGNEDTLIFTSATGDPYGADDSNPSALLSDHQSACNARIGNANFDMGHVFSTGAGGLAGQGVICNTTSKGRGATGMPNPTGDGYDIDYVAHEIGHQFGAFHIFNDNTSNSCSGFRIAGSAFEPGSGSSIMSYAGICAPDDLQPNSDAYFHAKNLNEIYDFINAGGGTCPVYSPTYNLQVSYAPFTGMYSIPYLTPFELTSPVAADSVADSVILYCWEEFDLSAAPATFLATLADGPLFRSFYPSLSEVRSCPQLSMVLAGVLSDAGIENAQGEKVPEVARTMLFRCTFRDIIHNMGIFIFPDDSVIVDAVNTGSGFKVTSQSTPGITYIGYTSQMITWDVAGTTAAPISCANVDIYMSDDGGHTWPYTVGTFPNTGTASITVPNPTTTSTSVRFKVKGSGNLFYNITHSNIKVEHNQFPLSVASHTVSGPINVQIFPIPATEIVHITTGGQNNIQAIIINAVGQTVWQGQINGQTELNVATWAKGVYHARLMNETGNEQAVKSFVVE